MKVNDIATKQTSYNHYSFLNTVLSMEVCFISYACKSIPYSEIDESFCTCYRRRSFKIRKMHIKCFKTSAFKEIFHPVRLLCLVQSRAVRMWQ